MPSILDRDNVTNLDLLSSSECKVVVLEDSKDVQNAIKEVIEDEFRGQLQVVKNKEEAIKILKTKQADCFIFDSCIGKNRQEGLDALEQIRLEDKTVFIAVFSAYPRYQERALKLGCNLFVEKSPNLKDCIRYIVREMLQYKFEVSMRDRFAISSQRITQKIELPINDSDRGKHPVGQYQQYLVVNKDRNIKEYETLKTNENWFQENQGKYAAFVDGKWIKSSDDSTEKSKKRLLSWLINQDKHRDKQMFFAKVELDSEAIDEPSSLLFD